MYGNWFSARGNNVGNEMNTEALSDAVRFYKRLKDVEFRGRGDREKSIRGRLSKSLGIAESYLFRLEYKAHEMKDVAGEAYRRLRVAYDRICEKNEQAADRYRAERLSMDGNNETAVEESQASSVGTVSAGVAKGSPASGEFADRAEGVMK